MVACLVRFLCSVFPGFNWFLSPIGLVDVGSVRALPFGAFPWPFFYFWCAQLEFFSVSQTLVRRFGGLSVSVGVWYWIWFPLYGGPLTCE